VLAVDVVEIEHGPREALSNRFVLSARQRIERADDLRPILSEDRASQAYSKGQTNNDSAARNHPNTLFLASTGGPAAKRDVGSVPAESRHHPTWSF
jgi:hypothetical protein